MTFLYSPRSLKRNRLLKKVSLVCLALSLGVLFYLAKNGPDNELRSASFSSSSPSSFQHQRYHLHEQENNKQHLKNQQGQQDEQFDIDVTVPRHAILDSLRKARESRLSRINQQTNPEQQQPPLAKIELPSQQQQQKQKQQQLSPPPPSSHDISESANQTTTVLEDKVYKSSRDDLYLPHGNGKDPEEKYIGFYPHSGFHNQRIALVNALMLAERLNRTLLMPPVMLGSPIHWRKHDSLDSYHRRTSKATLDHCRTYLNNPEPQPSAATTTNDTTTTTSSANEQCHQSFKYTSLRWDRLFDLDKIKQRVRIRYRDDYERAYLERNYDISRSDIYYVKDNLLYDYRIVETNRLNNKNPVTVGKYQRIIAMDELEARQERMISFGSLFGNGRVIVNDQMPTLDYFNRQLTFQRKALPGLFDEMDRMLALLGGPLSYISIHARVGDSIFERYAPEVMEKLWSDLQMYMPLLKNSNYNSNYNNNNNNDNNGGQQQKCYQMEQPQGNTSGDGSSMILGPAVDWDRQLVLGNRPLVMFMATDTPRPREHELFKNIYDTFPCVVTLNDLFDFVDSPLATMVNPEDGVNYGKFLIPFLDGLMASRAQSFSGSMWSTFSKYIQFLHHVYMTSD